MSDLSASSDLPPDRPGQLGEEPDETVFRSIAERLKVPGQPDRRLEQALADKVDTMVQTLGEKWVGGPWNPNEDIPEHTMGYLDAEREKCSGDLESALRAWADQLDADEPIRMLLYLWWYCWGLWEKSLAYRTIEAVDEAVAKVATGSARDGWPPWQGDTWRAVGAALQLIRLNGRVFAQINLSSAEGVRRITHDEAIPKVTTIRDDLRSALAQLADLPGDARKEIRLCVSYMQGYADQALIFCRVIEKMAGALVEFERWLASARHVDGQKRPGAVFPALWPLSLNDAPRARVVEALEFLEKVKGDLGGYILSTIEPWEQMLIGLRELMTVRRDRHITPRVLIPRQVWVRYCFPFAVDDDDGKRADRLLHVGPETPQRSLSIRLREELKAKAELRLMEIGEPTELADTAFFQVGTGRDGHFGGIRIDLGYLKFVKDFLDGDGHRLYRAWLDLNWMGNFCLCVEAIEPLKNIPPSRLYRALRAGTPFVYGEPVTLVLEKGGGEVGQLPKWDNLCMFARGMIRAAADAYYFSTCEKAREASPGPAHYIRANLHEVVIVQTDAPIAVQSEEIASHLDNAVGGRILLRSLQRAAGTLEEWTRFPPLQRARTSAILAVPEIGYAGDWFVHTGETTVFGIVAVPSWFRDLYPEAAQFASSWSPVLQLWNRHLRDAIKSHDDDAAGPASKELRNVEQQVRRHLAEINAEDLCATLAYRRFLDVLLEAVGISRLEKELETQLQAAEQLMDYFHQDEEKRAAGRRDILLFFITLLGVFSLADFLALLDTTDYHGRIGFIRLSYEGHWQDALVLILFGVALVSGIFVLFGDRLRKWLRKMRESRERKGERKRSVA
jgi:hypothetical protein